MPLADRDETSPEIHHRGDCAAGRGDALDPALDVSQYAHAAWKIRDGFYKGTIHAIAQTPDGYLWLGTDFGLFRFDGVRMVPWRSPRNEHLPSGHIQSLLISRDGRLWIGTDGGLASWKDGELTPSARFTGAASGAMERTAASATE